MRFKLCKPWVILMDLFFPYLENPHNRSPHPHLPIQADPLALTIVNERVGLRPAVGGGGPASIHRMAINPDDLAVRFGRQDVLSKAEAGHILDQVG